MSRLHYFLFCNLFAAALCTAQPSGWNVQQGGFWFLNSVHFINADTGFVAGFRATALRTTNGGATWKQMNLPADIVPQITIFSSVSFSTATKGCLAFGDSILYTNDGGNTWSRASLDAGASISRFIFISSTTGYAAGGSTTPSDAIVKTNDGGATWHHVHPPVDSPNVQYWGADFRDAQHGMVITALGEPPCYDLWRTADGCATWQRISDSVIEPCSHELFAISHITGTTWVIGGNSIQRSTDDGATWSKVSIFPSPTAFSFADSSVGYAACNTPGIIYKTLNGGLYWAQQKINADSLPIVHDICAPTKNICFAVGGYYPTNLTSDVILFTEDGGGGVRVDENIFPSQSFAIYPNPTTENATIKFDVSTHDRVANIFDQLGRIVASARVPANAAATTLNTASLQPGMYWCRIGNVVQKIGILR